MVHPTHVPMGEKENNFPREWEVVSLSNFPWGEKGLS